jgi:hypothetical protein
VSRRRLLRGLLCTALPVLLPEVLHGATPVPATEHQVKAVFLYNFTHFVQWPAARFASPGAPFVIGMLGGEALAAPLDEAVRGESVDGHPLQVKRFGSVAEIEDCHILFIDRGAAPQLESVLARVEGRGTLTVSDMEDASRRGVMIQLATRNSRIRLLINVDSARTAGLTISSNLLRPAEIVRTASN